MMAMTATHWGLLTGLALGFAGAFGGFVAFLVVLVLAALGLAVGRYLDGQLELTSFTVRPRERTLR